MEGVAIPHTNTVSLIVSLVLIGLLLICVLCLKIIKAKHDSDPTYQKRMAESRREEKRLAEEEKEIDAYFASDSLEYADDDNY